MRSSPIRSVIASALIAGSLAACAHSDGPAPVVAGAKAFRVTLPEPPEGVEACLRASFPEIPDRALTRADVARIIGRAKVLDRSKTACGNRSLAWIEGVRRELAR